MDDADTIIQGDKILVEIDESKLGKRKYNGGYRVEGFWIISEVERTDSKELFLVKAPDRSAETFIASIAPHVVPGLIVMTGLCVGYSSSEETLEM